MKTIEFNGKIYPHFQSTGNAARFIIPFAQEVCFGEGYDIGFGRHEWKFKDKHDAPAIGIDLTNGRNALHLPDYDVDYIFSSHCLEHLPNWVDALDHWITRLKENGILFLYLPHPDQEYWRPYNNRKHIHILEPLHLYRYFQTKKPKNLFISECDLNHSYAVIFEK